MKDSYSYTDTMAQYVWKPKSYKEDHVNCVFHSLVIWETFAMSNFGVIWLLHIHVLWFTKICDGLLFFFFVSFSAFVLVFFRLCSLSVMVPFLSPVSCLSPETNTSSSPLMKSVFGIENSPTKTGDNMKKKHQKKDKRANRETFVCMMLPFFLEGTCMFTSLKSFQRLVYISTQSPMWQL